MRLLNPNITFRLTKFDKALAFQILAIKLSWWTALTTLIPTNIYTATNGIIIHIGDHSDITDVIAHSIITIGGLTISGGIGTSNFTFSSLVITDDPTRDAQFLLILGALRELVTYVNSNGTLPHNCHNCFNLLLQLPQSLPMGNVKGARFCHWIDEVSDFWNIDTDYCVHFDITAPDQAYFEIYSF